MASAATTRPSRDGWRRLRRRAKSLAWVRATAPTRAPILYVPGNHDAFHCSWPHALDEVRGIADDAGIHLLPHPRSLLEGAWRQHADAAYASDLTEVLEGSTAPDLWVHGHIHVFRDYVVGRTRIVANARGYRKQNPAFDPTFTITL